MNNKNILTVDEAIDISKDLRTQKKKIVLAGGCFDILHTGHIGFLSKAKASGDVLFVLLESDESIQKQKGPKRPINNQEDRARMLSSLRMVDYVVILAKTCTNDEYDDIIKSIAPALLATTHGDLQRVHKERQAEKIGAQVVDVVEYLNNQSTSKIAKILSKEL